MDDFEYHNLVGRLTKIASIDVGEGQCTLWVVHHYTGSDFIEVYVIRNQKFLGRFEIQEQATFDCAWQSAKEHPLPASEEEILLFRKARVALLSLIDKFWPKSNRNK